MRWIVIALFSFFVVSTTLAEKITSVEDVLEKARNGDPVAQYELGNLYERGEGVEQNSLLAKKWFKTSAENGNSEAQIILSIMYLIGVDGAPQDIIRAYAWGEVSARQGNDRAKKWLKNFL